jgi:hypothetical protein
MKAKVLVGLRSCRSLRGEKNRLILLNNIGFLGFIVQ